MSWNPRDLPTERPSSFDEKGKRVKFFPEKVRGVFQKYRVGFYSFLLILFLIVPWTTFNGQQTIWLNISEGQFIFFGRQFWAHDGPLLFFPLLIAGVGLAFVTSVWGRIWCGWACPQTVFLEALFRPIERFIEGNHIKRAKLDKQSWNFEKIFKRTLKWLSFFIVSSHTAHSFTAYFVGAKNLFWITLASPAESWALFLFVQVFTLVLLFDFGWFREQFCIIMCPYGRFQSVLMGHNSLAVLYDEKRGEPRKQKGVSDHGDCVNCFKCVTACPMGIDIRRGLQLECIACTACIDACDEVMDKVGKPRNLIGYFSVNQLKGRTRNIFTPRSLTYLFVILLLISGFLFSLAQRKPLDLTLVRAIESPYIITSDEIINHFRLVFTNQSGEEIVVDRPRFKEGEVIAPEFPLSLKPRAHKRVHVFLKVSPDKVSRGTHNTHLEVSWKSPSEDDVIVWPIRFLNPQGEEEPLSEK